MAANRAAPTVAAAEPEASVGACAWLANAVADQRALYSEDQAARSKVGIGKAAKGQHHAELGLMSSEWRSIVSRKCSDTSLPNPLWSKSKMVRWFNPSFAWAQGTFASSAASSSVH